ncbi:putative barnase/colicin E5 family endoribonuclease [Helicobacter pylori]|uniref:putative barnase/colicin E5 family endoribonuclease n=1 Tax=Helicobacter pylori TaxID=210 RepID=UPI001896663C
MKLPKALNEATAGAALKYHIKRALERSHTISDFSKQLELSAKNSQFTNNTLKIIEELNNGVKQASDELSQKASDLQHAITPLKEFGKNYPEFALKPKEALEKLLQEKNGQVAGAAYRDDLGGIDFVWGTPKTKDSNGYGLAHILEKREKQYQKLGLTTEQAKERTNELLKEIPNILQKGFKEGDMPGYAAIVLNNSKVILSKFKGDNELKNHYMITSFEMDEKVLRELETIAPLSNDYRDGSRSTSNLNEPNLTQKPLTSQEDLLKTQEKPQKTTQEPLSPLELANAEKLTKLEHALTPLKEFGKNYPEFALKPKEALEKLLQEKNGQVAGAAYREDLRGIDFVWGTPKTKDSNGYGLAHILEKREKQYQRLGLNAEQIKERTDELVKSIPEVIENGTLLKDDSGCVALS